MYHVLKIEVYNEPKWKLIAVDLVTRVTAILLGIKRENPEGIL